MPIRTLTRVYISIYKYITISRYLTHYFTLSCPSLLSPIVCILLFDVLTHSVLSPSCNLALVTNHCQSDTLCAVLLWVSLPDLLPAQCLIYTHGIIERIVVNVLGICPPPPQPSMAFIYYMVQKPWRWLACLFVPLTTVVTLLVARLFTLWCRT